MYDCMWSCVKSLAWTEPLLQQPYIIDYPKTEQANLNKPVKVAMIGMMEWLIIYGCW